MSENTSRQDGLQESIEAKLEFIKQELNITQELNDGRKFRVFDLEKRSFLPENEECFISLKGDKLITADGTALPMERLVIQPSIGENDCNGRPIYLGDLLRTDENGWKAVVVYGRGSYMCEDENGGFSSFLNWQECEVIGNIADMYAENNVQPWLD